MAMRLMSGLPARVIQGLKDYLPAELDLIDAEEIDGITTPDIAAADYYEYDRKAIPEFPACTIRTVSSLPVEIKPDGFGRWADVFHRLDVMLHATLAQEATPSAPDQLQKLMHRYVAGAIRVLCVMKEALQTSADPTRFVTICEWVGEASYGPEEDQDEGVVVRTATLPIRIRRIEQRG